METLFAILLYILNVLDLIITKHFISMFGLGVEANPIGVWLFEHNLAEFVKIFVGAFGIFCMWLPAHKDNFLLAKIMIYVVFALYLILTIYHIYLLILVYS